MELRKNVDFALRIGFLVPSRMEGPHKELPPGWLMLPRCDVQTPNLEKVNEIIKEETGEAMDYIYISPKGLRFTSLQQALKYAQKQEPLLDHLPADGPTTFNAPNTATVQFTSNHEDYMHRGHDNLLAEMPPYIYNMWVYSGKKMTGKDPRANSHVDIPFDAHYRIGNVMIQRLSIRPRVPQIEGLQIPSPDTDPHKYALIKLLLFKPLQRSREMDDEGNPIDPFQSLYKSNNDPVKRHKQDPEANPYDAFVRTWEQYWKCTVLPAAKVAKLKLNKRMEWPTLWECEEVFLELMRLGEVGPFASLEAFNRIGSMSYAQQKQECQQDDHAQAKLQNRLTIHEYCCFMIRKLVKNLDAFARAKSAPKTKSYALDADAVEDPNVHRVQPAEGDDFEAAPDHLFDGDVDGFVRLKVGDAPAKVYHPLSKEARAKALAFFRQKRSTTPSLKVDRISVRRRSGLYWSSAF